MRFFLSLSIVITTAAFVTVPIYKFHKQSLIMNARKPKSFDDWAKYREKSGLSTRQKNNTEVDLSNSVNDTAILNQIYEERRMQFDAHREGNRYNQMDILRRHLH
mmetsp:Transcript_19257/g.25003  ORF Transcript_19257/g.25003 Transcript_19257/m.25003 type:complete len:105 (+) Transcript_19257:205-519(+)